MMGPGEFRRLRIGSEASAMEKVEELARAWAGRQGVTFLGLKAGAFGYRCYHTHPDGRTFRMDVELSPEMLGDAAILAEWLPKTWDEQYDYLLNGEPVAPLS
jgi:hypothetical protein